MILHWLLYLYITKCNNHCTGKVLLCELKKGKRQIKITIVLEYPMNDSFYSPEAIFICNVDFFVPSVHEFSCCLVHIWSSELVEINYHNINEPFYKNKTNLWHDLLLYYMIYSLFVKKGANQVFKIIKRAAAHSVISFILYYLFITSSCFSFSVG